MNSSSSKVVLVLAFLFMAGFGVSRAHAQSIALAPALVDRSFKPGVPFEIELAAANEGDTPVAMNVEIDDYWYDQKNERIYPPAGTSPHSAANWIQFVPERFEVGAKKNQQMKAIITPPADARGGYYALLFVDSAPMLTSQKTKEGGAVYTRMRLGCVVLLHAENTEEYKVNVGELKITVPSGTEPLTVEVPIANESNVHILPQAKVVILDSNKKIVSKADGPEERLLPGQKGKTTVKWSGDLKPGTYSLVMTLIYGKDKSQTKIVPLTVPAS